MNATEQLLTQHLRDIAAQAEPTPDLDAVRSVSSTSNHPLVRRAGRPAVGRAECPSRPQRRWFAPAAAAAVLILGAAGVVWVLGQRSPSNELSSSPTTGSVLPSVPTSTPAVSSPRSAPAVSSPRSAPAVSSPRVAPATDEIPTAFPVVDSPADGLSVTPFAGQSDSTSSEALIGRFVDGILVDPIYITVDSKKYTPSTVEGKPPTPTTVMGEPAMVYSVLNSPEGLDATFVLWGAGPYFAADGADPAKFLSGLAPGVIAAVPSEIAGDPATIEIGDLPGDYEVIVPSQPLSGRLLAGLQVGEYDFEVRVSARNPMAGMARVFSVGGQLRRVDVNGQPGWMVAPPIDDASGTVWTNDLSWQVDDSTYVYIKVNDGSSDDRVLEFAKSIRFVDFDTWNELYSGTELAATTGPPATTRASGDGHPTGG